MRRIIVDISYIDIVNIIQGSNGSRSMKYIEDVKLSRIFTIKSICSHHTVRK